MTQMVDTEAAAAVQPVGTTPLEGPQPPTATSGAASPAPEAPREPKPETVALVEAVVPTFEQMMRKPVAKDDLEFELPQEEGDPIRAKAHLEAIDGPAYDSLQSKFPPSAVQRAQGQAFDINKFAPALLARVVRTPSFTEEQWGQLWGNPRWSGGELASLFWAANGLCLKGLNVPLPSSG